MTIPTWQQKAQAKQAEAAAKIPQEWRLSDDILQTEHENVLNIPRTCGILNPKELLITEEYEATALVQQIASGTFSAVGVTRAFCKRAAIAQQLTCCLTETMFDLALARAKELDDHFAATGKTIGPLHGLPVSLKETFNVAGIPSSLGFVSFLDRGPVDRNSALVDILLSAGAVLYVKTNVPQTMMTADSHNNVFGRVLNPHHRSLTAGGSSGGEGALIAMRGSLMGIGTDIAGSIRIPALCCGTFGFKPSVGRVPYAGQTSAARPGMMGIAPVAGPLCHSARDAELMLKVIFNAQSDNMDDAAMPFPWMHTTLTPSKPFLTIGILPEDAAAPLHPPISRTIIDSTKALAAAGHRIVDLTDAFPSLKSACDIAFRFFNMDPDKTQLKHIANGDEPPIPSLSTTYDLDGRSAEPTVGELFDLNARRGEVAAAVRKAFLDHDLDFIIGPGYQSCAVPHDTYGTPMYTVLANLIDYPSCIIPFGQANEALDAEYIKDVTYVPPYLPKEVEGSPCHVQLIGRRLRDEMLIEHAKVVEGILSGKK